MTGRHLALLLSGILALAGSGAAAAQAPSPPPQPLRVGPGALAQMQVLMQEKRSRTPAQQKMDSHLVFALLNQRQDARLAALPALRLVSPDPSGRVLVDVKAVSTAGMKAIIRQLRGAGAALGGVSFRYRTVRAKLPLAAAEALAAMAEVRRIDLARTPIFSRVDSEGDATHRAAEARNTFGVDGTGVKICALSNGVDSLALLQTNGTLPPGVDVLPGQAGAGDEGTAMLEILHDLAPGAALGFATADGGDAQLAQNILDLRNVARCDILVDDAIYPDESPFQDNDPAQAVATVTAAGALYFSSAGNEGNLDAGTSGNWEGDFKANGNLDPVLGAGAGATHDFGDGGQSVQITGSAEFVSLFWTDPFGASANDYDLYILDSTLQNVLDFSTNPQNGTGDPFEITSFSVGAGERVVVTKFSGADRMLHVEAFRGTLALATAGCTHGHSAVPAAFSTAAAPAAGAAFPGAPSGPFPGPFTSTQLTELFTCDGPRRIYFDSAGNLLPGAPAGDFSAAGGVLRQKPDLTAADGVHTDVNGFQFFFGTSAAAPHAAAIAGLVESALPGITPAALRTALTGSAIDIQAPGPDRDTGAGIVMAFQALQTAGALPAANLSLAGVTPSLLAGKRGAGPAGLARPTPPGSRPAGVSLARLAGSPASRAKAGVPGRLAGDAGVPGNLSGDAGVPGILTGEDWALSIVLQNVGGAAATGITAVLTTATPGVRIIQGTATWPDLAVGASAANTSQLSFSSLSADCGTVIQFTLAVAYSGGHSPQSFNFTLQTGRPGTPVTFSYTGPPVPIPDGGSPPGALNEFPGPPAVVPLIVSGLTGRLQGLTFSLDGTACTTAAGATTVGVDHTFVNDLSFDLVSPAGTDIQLISRIDIDGHNFCQVVLDDGSAGPSIETAVSAQAPFTGSWLPANPLATFKGENPNGTWQLQVVDHFGQDTGSVRAFSLTITPPVCDAAATAALISATKTVSGAEVEGGMVTYTVVLTNRGTGAQPDNPGHEFTDTLPSQLTLLGASATAGTVATAGNTVAWDGGILAGDSVTITITARVNAGTLFQTVSNQGQVAFDPARAGSNSATTATSDPARTAPLSPTTFVVAATDPAAIPALSPAGLAAFGLLLLGSAALALRRSRRPGARRTPDPRE